MKDFFVSLIHQSDRETCQKWRETSSEKKLKIKLKVMPDQVKIKLV